MNPSLSHLHVATATHADRVRTASGAARTSRRVRRGATRSLRDLFVPRLQPRAAW